MLALHGETSNVNTGKIEVVHMGNENNGTKSQDCYSWDEKERCDSNTYAGRRRTAGYQSKSIGSQSQRAYRTHSQGASYLRFGSETDGGVVNDLINEYRDQVAIKQASIKTLELEISQIESRIQQFEVIQVQLSNQLQEVS